MKPEDFRSPTWKRFSKYVSERVDELRKLNDNPSYGIEQTALIRGGISELSKILSLADEASLSPAVSPEELSALADPASNGD